MFKKAILGLAVAAAVATSASATSLDVVTGFGGGSQPAARFYSAIPSVTDMKLVLGVSTEVYTDSKSPSGSDNNSRFDLLLGSNHDLPFLGNVDTYGSFRFGGLNLATGEDGNSFLTKIGMSKKWMVKLTDKVNIGVQIPLIEIWTNGTKKIQVLNNVMPQLGMTIDF